jgi:hypothetical protein
MGVETYLREHGLSFELLADRLSLGPEDILFVTGPVVDGTGDSESVLEVVLLTDEAGFRSRAERFVPERRTQQRRRGFGILYERVGAVDLDVEVHLTSTVERLLSALAALNPWSSADVVESFDSLGGAPRDAAVELLHRLRIGQPVWGAAAFEALRSRLDARRFAVWNVHHALIRAKEAMADTRRSLRHDDTENACLKLSVLYDALGDAVLFARGESIDRWVWRLPKLRALGPSAFLRRYLDVRLMRRSPGELPGTFVERQLDAAADFVERLCGEASITTLVS